MNLRQLGYMACILGFIPLIAYTIKLDPIDNPINYDQIREISWWSFGLIAFGYLCLFVEFLFSTYVDFSLSVSTDSDKSEEEDEVVQKKNEAREISNKVWTFVRILGSFDEDSNWYGYLCVVDQEGNPRKINFSDSHKYVNDFLCIRDGEKITFRYTDDDQDPDDYEYTASCFLIPFVSKQDEQDEIPTVVTLNPQLDMD